MKDHEIRELVDKLRDTALAFHATQQLRARIADVIVPPLRDAALHAHPPAQGAAPAPAMDDADLQEFCIALSFEQDDYTVEVIRAVENRMRGISNFVPRADPDLARGAAPERNPLGRDADWILAMSHALGQDSGLRVPIVPTVAAFKELFDALAAVPATPPTQQQDAPQAERSGSRPEAVDVTPAEAALMGWRADVDSRMERAGPTCWNCDTALPKGCEGTFKDDGLACLLNRGESPETDPVLRAMLADDIVRPSAADEAAAKAAATRRARAALGLGPES